MEEGVNALEAQVSALCTEGEAHERVWNERLERLETAQAAYAQERATLRQQVEAFERRPPKQRQSRPPPKM